MKLIIEPDDGLAPILAALRNAKKSIEIVIFRFDSKEIESELKAAAERGIFVYALIADAHHGAAAPLRQLEMGFLDAGITVARTAHDLIRYHDKMLLIDRKTLYVLSFNYTAIDIERSRGFGIITENRTFVLQAIRLFEADTKRLPYTPSSSDFVVSPINARKELSQFIKNARQELLIYDPKISDSNIIRILSERHKAGVTIKIIGTLAKPISGLISQKLADIKLHTRTIIRDRNQVYVGSASLRKPELDARRELGLIVRNPKVVRKMVKTFHTDWHLIVVPSKAQSRSAEELARTAEIILQELPLLATTVRKAVKRVLAKTGTGVFADKKIQETVKKAVKKAVKETIKEVAEQMAAKSKPA